MYLYTCRVRAMQIFALMVRVMACSDCSWINMKLLCVALQVASMDTRKVMRPKLQGSQ